MGLDTTDEWITQRTGVRERRIADPDVTTSDLALEASRKALEMAGLTAGTWISSSSGPSLPTRAARPPPTGSRRNWMRLRP